MVQGRLDDDDRIRNVVASILCPFIWADSINVSCRGNQERVDIYFGEAERMLTIAFVQNRDIVWSTTLKD